MRKHQEDNQTEDQLLRQNGPEAAGSKHQDTAHGESGPVCQISSATQAQRDGASVSLGAGLATGGQDPVSMTAKLPAEGQKVVTIPWTPKHGHSLLTINAILVVAEQNEARVAATNGHPWSVGQAHIDSPKSSKFGISLTAALQVFGAECLHRGDLVQIEIGRGDTCYRLTGRVSRKAAAYFAKTDLAQAGVELHTPFHYVVLGIVSPSGVEGGQP